MKKVFFNFQKISIAIFFAATVACSQASHLSFTQHNEAPPPPPPVQKASKLVCEYDPTNYRMNGRLLSFYLKGSGSFATGIDLVSSILSFLGFKAEWTTFRMGSYLEMFNAYEMDSPAVWNEDNVQKSDLKFSLEATIQSFNTGISNSSKVIFEDMVASAFLKNLKALDKIFKDRKPVWETSVYALGNEGMLVIPTGEAVGLRVGDTLNIYKGDFLWTGKPCESTRYFAQTEGPEWIAEAKVAPSSAGLQNIAVLKITKQKEGQTIERGDLVRFKEFAPSEKKRSDYKFAVRVDKVDQLSLRLEDGRKIEITSVLKSIMEKAINQKYENYYIKKSSPFMDEKIDEKSIELYRAKEIINSRPLQEEGLGHLLPKSSSAATEL